MRSKDWIKGAAFGFIVTAVLGVGFGAMADHGKAGGKRRWQRDAAIIDGTAIAASVTSALDELAQIERINDQSKDRKTKQKMSRRLADLRSDLQLLQQDIADAPRLKDFRNDSRRWKDDDKDGWYEDQGVQDTRDDYREDTREDYRDTRGTTSSSLSDTEIENMIDEVNKAMTSQGRLQLIRDAANGRWVTTAQIIRVMNELSFSNDRIEVAAMLHGNCSDTANFYQVYSHLAFDADRATLKKRLGQ